MIKKGASALFFIIKAMQRGLAVWLLFSSWCKPKDRQAGERPEAQVEGACLRGCIELCLEWRTEELRVATTHR